MKRAMIAALAATALTGGAALAQQSVIVYDQELGEDFAMKREIVEIVKEHYENDDVVYSSGNNLPEGMATELMPGEPVPSDAPMEPIGGELAEALPHSKDGTRWVEIGEHLVEVGEDGRAVLIVYDVVR